MRGGNGYEDGEDGDTKEREEAYVCRGNVRVSERESAERLPSYTRRGTHIRMYECMCTSLTSATNSTYIVICALCVCVCV